MASTNSQIPILFRYFMVASLMRQEFDKHITDPEDIALVDNDPMKFWVSKAGLKMCLWYGMLYVVIEGWQDANLTDPEIDRLLSSPNTKLLKRFRWNVPFPERPVASAKALRLFYPLK
jgi:hypothetical protein